MGYAHRYSWEIHNSKIPSGLHVCHSCDNPSCVNPEHLWLGTAKDNYDDMVIKNRSVVTRGENIGSSKLTECDVLFIRKLKETTPVKEIAKRFNVSWGHVYAILSRKMWKHI